MDERFAFLKNIIEMDPFLKHVGIRVISLEEGYAKLSMEFREEITRIGNTANGGAILHLLIQRVVHLSLLFSREKTK